MNTYQLDVVATRGGVVESLHRVHGAVVDAGGRLIGTARDPRLRTFLRSCAKPFQVMPLLESGGLGALGWGDEHLALACASHGGEPEHVTLAASMLRSVGLAERDLACGPHEPLSLRGAAILLESGQPPTRLHNNCSGKHAAMLARASLAGWRTAGYERREHPVQQSVLAAVSEWCAVATADIDLAVDGCGVVVFGLPLTGLARAFARLAAAADAGEIIPAAIAGAIASHPLLFGGTDRFDSLVVAATGGRVIPKVGAEGVHAVALLDLGLGVVVKVEDGAQRAQYPAVIRILQHLGALPETLPPALASLARTSLRNTRDEVVGEVVPIDIHVQPRGAR